MKKKIAIVVPDLGSYLNFLEEFAISIIDFYTVYIVTSSNSVIDTRRTPKYKDQIIFYYIDFPRSFSPIGLVKSSIRFRNFVINENINYVYSHFTAVIFSSTLFPVKNCIYIGMFHGLNVNVVNGFKRFIFAILELFPISRLDYIFVINQQDFDFLKSHKISHLYKITPFGLGCNLEKFNFSPSPYFTFSNIQIIELVFVGRFVDFKGFSLLIDLFKSLEDDLKYKFCLKLVGDFDKERPSGLNEEQLSYLKNNSSITVTGFVNNVGELLESADFFIFLSNKEGLPVSLLEAIVSGKIVIALNSRGANDIIEHGINGFLVDANNSSDKIIINAKNLIYSLLQNKPKILKVLNYNLNSRLDLSRDKFVSEQKNFFKKLLNSKANSH